MKVAILGTRGIPNHYGGFEQYAELLSVYWASLGWEVTVYNSHNHPYQQKEFKGVSIRHIYDPEHKIGTVGQFIYDLGCILDIRKQKYDVVYQLGYTSSAIFNFLLPSRSFILTNMDGMEWKRSKYSKKVQKFLMYSERIAVKHSHQLIADSLGVKAYLDEKYKLNSFFSAYTASIPSFFEQQHLSDFDLSPQQYCLAIARLEPENNIEMIIEGYLMSDLNYPLIIVGKHTTEFGTYLKNKYTTYPNIRFVGSVYNKAALDAMRYFSHAYFHGHSVGGTNPSLLEAMAASCTIFAHENVFNKSVLEVDAHYFEDAASLTSALNLLVKGVLNHQQWAPANLEKIKKKYSEPFVFGLLTEKLKDWIKR